MYFGSLALARFILTLVSSVSRPVTFINLPQIPVDAFNMCPVQVHLMFKVVPNSLSTVFGALACQSLLLV